MSLLKELLDKRVELDAQIEEVRKKESVQAIEAVKKMVAEFGLTKEDIFGTRQSRSSGRKGAGIPKYRNPDTGQTWSGFGPTPKWMAGQDRERFLIR